MKHLVLVAFLTLTVPAALAQRPTPPDYVEVATQPAPLADGRVEPAYPDAARRESIESRVILRLWIRADGGVEAAELMRQAETRRGATLPAENTYAPLFSAAATDAALQRRFSPAIKDDTPVDVWVTLPMRFRQNR